jgi:hypothetical protein
MAVAGVWAASMFGNEVGTIGTSYTFTKPQDFTTPQNILALPLLRYNSESDDQTMTDAYISKFIDNNGSHTGHFMGIAATGCTHIDWSLYCDHSFNNPTRLIFFLG